MNDKAAVAQSMTDLWAAACAHCDDATVTFPPQNGEGLFCGGREGGKLSDWLPPFWKEGVLG